MHSLGHGSNVTSRQLYVPYKYMKNMLNKLLNKTLSNQMTSPLTSGPSSTSKKMTTRLRVDFLSLSSLNETRKKHAISRASCPGILNGHIFSRFIYGVARWTQ